MKNLVLVFSLLLILSSCKKEVLKSDLSELSNIENNSTDLYDFVKYDTLFISARFDECGEWGGHKEVLEIFSKRDEKLYLNFKKNNVDCDKVDETYDAELSLVKAIELDDHNKNAIIEYMVQLLQSKINEGNYDHSGKEFEIMNSDSTLYISVYDNSYENPTNYYSLLDKLGLK